VKDMHHGNAAILQSVGGDKVALKGVNVEAELRDLLAEVSVTQIYKNEEPVNIEAVYTFPLPTQATLLDLAVTIDGRVHKGVIVGKQTAEDRYEDAVTEGDTAIMLQQKEFGLYTMNVGNLQAGETAVIRFRYVLLQQWSGDRLRFMLPTVIAPRYGDPAGQGLEPHQIPEWDFGVAHAFSLTIRVHGLLENGDIESPSHDIAISKTDKGTIIRLTRESAMLDRDFILILQVRGGQQAAARADRDFEGYVALASFRPMFNDTTEASPRNVKVVVDCSGSMGGDSIAQAREALLRILDSLRPHDRFNIMRFGSHHDALFPAQVVADRKNLRYARRIVTRLDADMGGTEIGEALRATYELRGGVDMPPDLLLVTDGEVWDMDSVIREARDSGHRIFTVGVGAAVAESFVRRLAEESGGVCELVSPHEDMAQRIHRQFERICSPLAQDVAVAWPNEPVECFPEVPGPVYQGATVHLLAWFSECPAGDVCLTVTLPNGDQSRQTAAIQCDSAELGAREEGQAQFGTLARLGAARKLMNLEEILATELAVRYQLISPYTHYLVVDERNMANKAEDLPTLRKVPQMLAAGWGGVGSIKASLVHVTRSDSASWREDFDQPTIIRNRNKAARRAQAGAGDMAKGLDYMDIPTFLRRQSDYESQDVRGKHRSADNPDKLPDAWVKRKSIDNPDRLAEILNQCSDDWFIPYLRIRTLVMLSGMGLPSDVIMVLSSLVKSGKDEAQLVIVFLHLLAGSKHGKGLKREARRAIAKAYKEGKSGKELTDDIKRELLKVPRWSKL